MSTSQFNIKINVDTKEVDLGAASTLALNKQLRALENFKKENVGKLTAGEFELLSKKINETKDSLKSVNARSGEFLDTVKLLPGSLGQVGGSLGEAFDKLELFSSFKLTDLRGQFKSFLTDAKSVTGSFFDVTKGLDKVKKQTTENAVASEGAAKATRGQILAQNALTAAQKTGIIVSNLLRIALSAIGIGLLTTAVAALIANWDKIVTKFTNAFPIFGKIADFVGNIVNKFTDLIGVTDEASRAEERRQKTFEKQKASTEIVNQGIQRQIDLLYPQFLPYNTFL